MRLAHIAVIAPHRTGLYGTARDIVKAEIALGADARMIDPYRPRVGKLDGVPIDGHQWACNADVWISHSGTFPHLAPQGKPVVHVMHGRPYSSFLLGMLGKTMPYEYLQRQVTDKDYRAFVTLWPEFVPYWRMLIPAERLHYVPAPVDLGEWTPDGPDGYNFGGKRGEVNVVIADQWREDRNPHEVIHAFSVYAERVKNAKLHIYGAPVKNKGFVSILKPLARRGVLGEVRGFVSGLPHVYRAADVMLTPHRIATRTVREALACGCQVVMAPGHDYTPYTADPVDIEAFAHQIDVAAGLAKTDRPARRTANRAAAVLHFNPENTAKGVVAIAGAQI